MLGLLYTNARNSISKLNNQIRQQYKALQDVREKNKSLNDMLRSRSIELSTIQGHLKEVQSSFERYKYSNAIVDTKPGEPLSGQYRGSCVLIDRSGQNEFKLSLKIPPMRRHSKDGPWELDREVVSKRLNIKAELMRVEDWISKSSD